MSVHAPYTLLLEVASCDARVSHLTQTVADLSKKIAAQRQSFATCQEACACAPATLLGMKKAIDDLELQLKSIDDQLKHKKQQLDLITSEKQLHALEHEIAMLLRKKEELSDLQVDQWLAYETAQHEQEAQQSSTVARLEQLGADIASLESELEQAQISLANAEQGRQTALANLPSESRALYERMRVHVSDPVVLVHENACGGCFYPLPQPTLAKLRQQEMVSCLLCNRLLVLPAPTNVASTCAPATPHHSEPHA